MRYSDWDISGVLVRMGDEIWRLCKEFNKDIDLFGQFSFEKRVDYLMIRQADKMVRCFDGFSIGFDKSGLYYVKIWIEYRGEPVGLPWLIDKEDSSEPI